MFYDANVPLGERTFKRLVEVFPGTPNSPLTWEATPADEQPWKRPTYAAPYGTMQHPDYDFEEALDSDTRAMLKGALLGAFVVCAIAIVAIWG